MTRVVRAIGSANPGFAKSARLAAAARLTPKRRDDRTTTTKAVREKPT